MCSTGNTNENMELYFKIVKNIINNLVKLLRKQINKTKILLS